jgi:tetratricopeptide (TPR) repeat protein/transcriptional regulator with XRE-family HTH domain
VAGQPASSFADVLRQLRAEAGLTQEELAKAAGLGLRTVSDLERGAHRTAHQDTARLLAEALGLAGPTQRAFVAAARGRANAAEVLAAQRDALGAVVATASQPAAAAVSAPRELPADVGGFTGRAVELAELDLLMPDAPGQEGGMADPVVISAVSGTAGVGKTALAVRWAHRAAEQFPDGQLYVNLRGYDPEQPVSAGEALAGFLRALGMPGSDIPLEEAERAARYRSLAAGKRLLVVLDNAAAEEQVRPLLPGSASAMVVVTSRDSLAGLVARDGARRLDLDLLLQGEAVALLRTLIGKRAEADHAATDALAWQCARLPLALRVAAELAIARPDRPLADLVTELADGRKRLELLDAGSDPRAAVVSVFSWSYRHLPSDAARMFRLLGLHPGADWDRYAAAALTAAALARADRLLDVLARAHLIQPVGPGRYGMHDLLRAYAADLAAAHDEDEMRRAALTRLFDYYLAASSGAMDRLAPAERHHRPPAALVSAAVPSFGDRAAAVAWLDVELPALTAAAVHTASHGWPGHTIGLAATLYRYLSSGHDQQAMTIHTHALSAARRLGDRAAQAAELSRLAQFCNRHGGYQQAASYARQSLAVARAAGNRAAEARALGTLALTWYVQGRYQPGVTRYRQAIAVYQDLGDRVGEVTSLGNLGLLYAQLGRYQQAAALQQQALELYQQLDDPYGISYALNGLAETCFRQGQYQQATSLRHQAITRARGLGDQVLEADALTGLGSICHRQGRYGQATGYHRQALDLFEEAGVAIGQATALNGAGETLLATEQPGPACDHHTRALDLAGQAGDRWEQARALARLGDVCRRQGQPNQAADYDAQALSIYRTMGARGGQADALNGTGETFLATGQASQARACHAAALTKASQAGDRYQQARAHHGLARAYQHTGQQARAHQHWQRAHQIYAVLEAPETHDRISPHWAATHS